MVFFLPLPGPPAGAAGFFGGLVTEVRIKHSSFLTALDHMCNCIIAISVIIIFKTLNDCFYFQLQTSFVLFCCTDLAGPCRHPEHQLN